MGYYYRLTMNEENFRNNVNDIEFKCNELISEINQHLSLYCATRDNNGLQRNSNYDVAVQENENHQIRSSLIMASCHNEIIDFTNPKNKKSKNSNVLKVLIPKAICCSITKINQIIANDFSSGQVDAENDKLKVQHLDHVNIEPNKLTKQVAFQITCPKHEPSAMSRSNTGVFNFRYGQKNDELNDYRCSLDTKDNKIIHSCDSDNVTISKNDTPENFHDEDKNHYETYCENCNFTNEENQLRNYLFGNSIKGNSTRREKKISRRMKKNKNKKRQYE